MPPRGDASQGRFPLALKGYDRNAVDAFLETSDKEVAPQAKRQLDLRALAQELQLSAVHTSRIQAIEEEEDLPAEEGEPAPDELEEVDDLDELDLDELEDDDGLEEEDEFSEDEFAADGSASRRSGPLASTVEPG